MATPIYDDLGNQINTAYDSFDEAPSPSSGLLIINDEVMMGQRKWVWDGGKWQIRADVIVSGDLAFNAIEPIKLDQGDPTAPTQTLTHFFDLAPLPELDK